MMSEPRKRDDSRLGEIDPIDGSDASDQAATDVYGRSSSLLAI